MESVGHVGNRNRCHLTSRPTFVDTTATKFQGLAFHHHLGILGLEGACRAAPGLRTRRRSGTRARRDRHLCERSRRGCGLGTGCLPWRPATRWGFPSGREPGVPTTHVSDGFGHAGVIRTGVGRRPPAMNTPVVASSTTTGWLTVACPWCGTINNIGLFGVQTLPGCGHVLDVQRPVGAGR
jgi:hypothetical protein